MAKKSRRARVKQGSKSSTTQQAYIKQVQPGPSGNGKVAQNQAVSAVSTVKANQYDYVTGDLMRIGIVAGGLLLVLVVLTFILR